VTQGEPRVPPEHVVAQAVHVAALSPCRSKRGVVIWDPHSGSFRGHGFNSPPALFGCPGRAVCAGTCGQRTVHAEVRAIRDASPQRRDRDMSLYDLLHVELASSLLLRPGESPGFERRFVHGAVVACEGPSCGSCAALISDVGFIGGVWLLEHDLAGGSGWRRYTADAFYEATVSRSVPHRSAVH
jgi:hypothetical protein